ncbi:MAG: UPF0262 family protein [Rhodospirillales bacterium]
MPADIAADTRRIAKVVLEEPAHIRLSPQVEHERKAALFDLIEDNRFAPRGGGKGPFVLHLGIEAARLVFDVRDQGEEAVCRFTMPLGILRKVVKDYFLVLDSYFKAIRTMSPSRIEAIDMGRRSLHDEGAELLRAALAPHVEIDRDTARRLFTLVCVLHIRG